MGSSDSDSRKQKKKEKKPKKDKKHKKHKKNKKRKHSSSSESENASAIDVQKFYRTAMIAPVVNLNKESFGPALPPHLANKCAVVAPQPPKLPQVEDAVKEDDDYDAFHGPLPGPSRTLAQIELEQRALELKLGKLSEDSSKGSATVREEWMLELPDVGIKGGLDSLKRVFKTKEGPDFSDRSDWTTVADEADEFHKFEKKKRKEQDSRSAAEIKAEKERDEEQEEMAKKHRQDEKSLLQLHQDKMNEKRRLKGKEEKVDRRRFDRDVDLQLNKIDKSHTKKIVDGTKFLNSKFGSGRTKYL